LKVTIALLASVSFLTLTSSDELVVVVFVTVFVTVTTQLSARPLETVCVPEPAKLAVVSASVDVVVDTLAELVLVLLPGAAASTIPAPTIETANATNNFRIQKRFMSNPPKSRRVSETVVFESHVLVTTTFLQAVFFASLHAHFTNFSKLPPSPNGDRLQPNWTPH
jgi:hypothetical protein